MKTYTTFERTQVQQAKRARFNPLTALSSRALTRYLDAFEAGYLREAACVGDPLEQRDDLLRTVISKRKKAVGRQGWTVLPKPDVPAGQGAEAAAPARA